MIIISKEIAELTRRAVIKRLKDLGEWNAHQREYGDWMLKDCLQHAVNIESIPNKNLKAIAKNIAPLIGSKSCSIKGATWYPQFRILVVTGDGFPMARFVFSEDYKLVYFAFTYDQPELMHAANKNGIPPVFSFKDFRKHLKKIKV